MHAKYEVSISYGSKVIAKVKVENRQTNRRTEKQTDRQDKNNMPPIIRGQVSLNSVQWFQRRSRKCEKFTDDGRTNDGRCAMTIAHSSLRLRWAKNQGVFVKHYSMPPGGNKVEKAIFSFKVKVKVTRSLTLVSFERASLVEYACQIWGLYLLRFKSDSEG